MRSPLLCSAALLASLTLGGCASRQPLLLPRTLEPGAVRVGVTHSYAGPPSLNASQSSPAMSVSVRRGLGPRTELGVNLRSPMRASVDVKVQLARADGSAGSLDVALAPSLGGGLQYLSGRDLLPTSPVVEATLPVLVGVNLGGGHQLVAGPSVGAVMDLERSTSGVHLGGALGVAVHFSPLTLMPQVSYARYWLPGSGAPGQDAAEVGLAVWFGDR